MTDPSDCYGRSPDRRNITFCNHRDFRKAISPLFSFHGRIGPRPDRNRIPAIFATQAVWYCIPCDGEDIATPERAVPPGMP